jgi:hypothetical protein
MFMRGGTSANEALHVTAARLRTQLNLKGTVRAAARDRRR